ncbi:MAG: hypothetical protein G01um101413_112 [Parcubacteria group bacterium Gr01-1014_13]|nr:MAG: hypothetical protein G01um101413_112 [Parcubacteria group bacterium Gr01-1014_13]
MEKYQKYNLSLQLVVWISAIVIGAFQISINNRLKNLQDVVAIFAVPDDGAIQIHNVGKVNLYLHKFELPGKVHNFERPRLLPAGTGNSAYNWVPLPTGLKDGEEFDFKLYLTDNFNNKWIAEMGGKMGMKTSVINGKEQKLPIFIVWSYQTYKKDWNF